MDTTVTEQSHAIIVQALELFIAHGECCRPPSPMAPRIRQDHPPVRLDVSNAPMEELHGALALMRRIRYDVVAEIVQRASKPLPTQPRSRIRPAPAVEGKE